MLIFLIGLIGTLHSVFVVVQDMNQYPVDTTVTVTTEEYVLETKLILYQANQMLHLLFKIHFPSVTVCNQNRIDCIKLAAIMQSCNNDEGNCPSWAKTPAQSNTLEQTHTKIHLLTLLENYCRGLWTR